MIQTNIFVSLQIIGIHCWPDAKNVLPEVGYLSEIHLHKFFIEIEKKVENGDNDRNVELIMFERELQNYYKRNFYNDQIKCCDFKNMSCELIALDLLDAYNLESVKVTEDDNWGARVFKKV